MASSQSELCITKASGSQVWLSKVVTNAGRRWRAFTFVLPYGLLLAWFHGVDVYHRDFAGTGLVVIAYNCFRILFIFYLFCIIMTAGWLLLRAVARQELVESDPLERIGLCFFAGAGVWHVALFALGYLRLYTVPIAVLLTLPMVLLAYGPMCDAADGISRYCSAQWLATDAGRVPRLVLLALTAVTAVLLLLVKGIYPGGGHDYFTHYFYYFESVISHRGLWPNEVWYHYYYDKGAGLYFLGILITDPLAPQLVTFCCMMGAALVILLACRDAAPGTFWPWIAVLLFLVIFLYTPGWGQFEKSHELTTSLMIALFWAAARALQHCGRSYNTLWPTATCLIIAATIILTPTIAVLVGGVFAVMLGWHLLRGEFRQARMSLLFAMIDGILLVGSFVINYVTTGLMTDQLLLATWRITDIEKLYRWDALPMAIEQYWGLVSLVAGALKMSELPKLLIQSSRLDLVYPLSDGAILIALIAVLIRWRNGRWSGPVKVPHQTGILLAAIPVFVGIAFAAGRVQPISFYRYSGFAVPLMLVVAVGLWELPLSDAAGRFKEVVRHRFAPLVLLAACLVTFAHATPPKRFFSTLLPRTIRFAAGALSIDQAYALQPDPSIFPVNAIYPGARGAFAVVGPSTPIWSLHYLTYCMLPNCLIESMYSFILPNWYDVMYGTAEQARIALHTTGHDYFLFSNELPLGDALPLSPLFAPDNIARYLGIRWTDGTTTLLTWLGPGIRPLDQEWIASYRQSVQDSPTVRNFPYDAMKQIFAGLKATPHPWHPMPLPW